MKLKTQLSQQLESAGETDDIQKYDAHAKRILSNKMILSYILQRVVDELQGMSVSEIVSCIEGDVLVSQVPLTPENILGENQEDSVFREGKIFFDLRFSVIKQEERVKILFDVEAQKKYQPGYPIVTRGIVYGARMISRQIETEFKIPHYEELKKVYSIWLCFDPPLAVGNAISKFSIQKDDILGSVPADQADYDKLTVIMICLRGDTDEHGDYLIHLLNTIFSGRETADRVEAILEEDYGIPKSYDIGKEVSAMCNLGEGILEKGIQTGLNQAIRNALGKTSADKVAELLDVPLEQVKAVEEEMSAQN